MTVSHAFALWNTLYLTFGQIVISFCGNALLSNYVLHLYQSDSKSVKVIFVYSIQFRTD
jgi:hypothetical protein